MIQDINLLKKKLMKNIFALSVYFALLKNRSLDFQAFFLFDDFNNVLDFSYNETTEI